MFEVPLNAVVVQVPPASPSIFPQNVMKPGQSTSKTGLGFRGGKGPFGASPLLGGTKRQAWKTFQSGGQVDQSEASIEVVPARSSRLVTPKKLMFSPASPEGPFASFADMAGQEEQPRNFFKKLMDAQEGQLAEEFDGIFPLNLSVDDCVKALVKVDVTSFPPEALVAFLLKASHYVPSPDERELWAPFWVSLLPSPMSAKTGKMDWKLASELVEANSRVVRLCEPPAPSIAAARTPPFAHALHNQDTEMGDATHG